MGTFAHGEIMIVKRSGASFITLRLEASFPILSPRSTPADFLSVFRLWASSQGSWRNAHSNSIATVGSVAPVSWFAESLLRYASNPQLCDYNPCESP
jgi:hypothetical protein